MNNKSEAKRLDLLREKFIALLNKENITVTPTVSYSRGLLMAINEYWTAEGGDEVTS